MKPVDGFAFQNHVIKEIHLHMGTELNGDCRHMCLMESTCVSVNIGPPDKDGFRLCQLSDSDHIKHPEDLKPREGFIYWATEVRNYGHHEQMLCLWGFQRPIAIKFDKNRFFTRFL